MRPGLTARRGACYRPSNGAMSTLAVRLSVALLLSAPALAEAQSLLVLRVEHDKLDAGLSRQIDGWVRDEAKKSLPKVVLLPPPALDFPDMQMAAGCADDSPACLASIGRTLGASQVLRVQVFGAPKKAELRVALVQVQASRGAVQSEILEDVGEASEAELRYHVAKALGAKPAPLTGKITLVAEPGALDGAELFLDDKKVPRGALAKVEAGKHRLDVHQRDHEAFIWIGEVKGGRETVVQVELVPKRPAPPVAVAVPPPVERRPDAPSAAAAGAPEGPAAQVFTPGPEEDEGGRVYTWVLAGSAAVAAGAGVVLGLRVLSQEDQVVREGLDCPGADYDAAGCASGRRTALFTNLAWGAAGGLAVGAVLAYFLEDAGDDQAVDLGVAPTSGGAHATFRLRF